MSDEVSMNAFDVMMASSKRKADEMEGWDDVIAIGYEGKLCGEGVDPDDPLYGTCYFGIAVRGGFVSPDALGATRWREHERDSDTRPKDLGIRAIIARYGENSIVWRLVEFRTRGTHETLQAWANEWEKAAIAAAGGMLRNMEPEVPLRQTFNLTSGGQGDPRAVWENVEARCLAAWQRFQRALQAFVDDEGTSRVPRDYVDPSGYKIGARVTGVRQGVMLRGRPQEATRRAWLEALPRWTWNCFDTAWDDFKAALQAYVDVHETSRVPREYVDASGYPLGPNLHGVRNGDIYLKGRPEEAARRAWLEALPGWTWNCFDTAWDDFKAALQVYVGVHETARVPRDYVNGSGYLLGQHLHCVRNGDNYLKGRPDEAARRAWLEALPRWTWNCTDAAWEDFETALRAYVDVHETSRVPKDYVDASGYRLGQNVGCVRIGDLYLGGSDGPARREWLETLPGWTWDCHKTSWEDYKTALQAYVNQFGTSRVLSTYIDASGFPLGARHCSVRQGTVYLKDKPDEAARRTWLEALPEWSWNYRDDEQIDAWEKFKAAMVAFVFKTGSACVPFRYRDEDGFCLGGHVNGVRSLGVYLKGRDGEERRAWLNSLPGWVWNCFDQQWERFKNAISKYVLKTGTSRAPQRHIDEDGYLIGHTVNSVRQGNMLKNKKDQEARCAWLEALPGWTWSVRDTDWETFQMALQTHIRKTGSAFVETHYVDEDGYKLGPTLAVVRKGAYLKGKKDEAERRAWLDSLPGWMWDVSKEEGIAHANFELALLRATTHPNAKRLDVKPLRDAHYVVRAHEILRDRTVASVLDALVNLVVAREARPELTWDCYDAAWEDFKGALQAYVDEFGTSNVPRDYVNASDYPLGASLHDMRNSDQYLKDQHDAAARRGWLEALPGWTWSCWDPLWEEFKASLRAYADVHRTSRVPTSYVNASGYRLGQHLNAVRNLDLYLKGSDRPARRAWLETLPRWSWNCFDTAWESFQEALQSHVRKTGSTFVGQGYVDTNGYPLGVKLAQVRSRGIFLKGKKDEVERRAWLEALPGWVWQSTLAMGHAHVASELALLRATTHPNATRLDVKPLRNAHCVIRAHEIMRDRTIASVLDTLLDTVVARATLPAGGE